MDELGKAFPAAEGMVDAEQSSAKSGNEFCLNCNTKLIDKFCHHCGQKDIPKRQTLGELIENFIGSFYSFESKFFRTVRYLLFKPGFLPVEYNQGKRESYYHPARAYVFISFVFFLIFFSLPDDNPEKTEMQKEMKKQARKEMEEDLLKAEGALDSLQKDSALNKLIQGDKWIPAVKDSVKKNAGKKAKRTKGMNFSISETKYKSVEEYDSIQKTLAEDKRDGWWMRKINIRTIELNQKYKEEEGLEKFGEDFKKAFMDNFSKILFYLLPIFALLLKLLYIRRDFYYSEHLVFSIYYYNFFYLAASVSMLINLIPGVGFISIFINLWIFVYLLIAMKRMYLQSWRKTVLKYGIFAFLFFICVTVALIINAFFIIMWI